MLSCKLIRTSSSNRESGIPPALRSFFIRCFGLHMASHFMSSKNQRHVLIHDSGSMIGSLEFCIGKLKSRLVVVLGHTKCGAIYGATKEIWLQQPQTQAKGINSIPILESW